MHNFILKREGLYDQYLPPIDFTNDDDLFIEDEISIEDSTIKSQIAEQLWADYQNYWELETDIYI